MASKIDFGNLTLNNEEARSMAELVFEQLYSAPEITEVHGVQTGIDMDKYIPIFGQFGLVGKVNPGSCAVNTNTGTIPTSQKTWTPKLISDRLIHCNDNLPAKIKFWKPSQKANELWSNPDSQMMGFINDTLLDAMKQSILRISDFGDTAASPTNDGAGNMLLTLGTDKTYFNMLNGLWAQIFTDQALGTPLTYRYTITENAGATKAAQAALASNAALLVFRDMYNNIDARAFDGRNLVFQVTRSLFNNWQDYMEDKSAVFQLDRTENGSTKWSYRGVPIIVRQDWDRFIRTYHDLGANATWYLPHRAILTDLNNIPIGTPEQGSMSEVMSNYDFISKSWYLDFAYKIDCKLLQEYALACAY